MQLKFLFWNDYCKIIKLMFSVTSGVSLWYRSCFKKILIFENRWEQMLKTHNNIRVDFLWLRCRYCLSLRALTSLEKFRICLQISNEFHRDVIRYKYYSWGFVDPFYCRTLISSVKNHIQIAFAELINFCFL